MSIYFRNLPSAFRDTFCTYPAGVLKEQERPAAAWANGAEEV